MAPRIQLGNTVGFAILFCLLAIGAAALIFRYQVTPLSPAVVVRLDRITGRVVFITTAGKTLGEYPGWQPPADSFVPAKD